MYATRITGETCQEALEHAAAFVDELWGSGRKLLLKTDEPTVVDYITSGLVTPGWEITDEHLVFSREIGGRRVLVLDLMRAFYRMEDPMDLCFTPGHRSGRDLQLPQLTHQRV